MKKEIERRFLVDSSKLPYLKKGKLLTQGYLSELKKSDDPLIRVRTEGKKAFLTIKLVESPLTRLEFEYPIKVNEAQKLLDNCLFQVQKIRYSLKIGKHSWSVDVYEGENFPLVVAEIELATETQKFEKPLWLGKEVTHDPRFHAYSLAQRPFNSWKNN